MNEDPERSLSSLLSATRSRIQLGLCVPTGIYTYNFVSLPTYTVKIKYDSWGILQQSTFIDTVFYWFLLNLPEFQVLLTLKRWFASRFFFPNGTRKQGCVILSGIWDLIKSSMISFDHHNTSEGIWPAPRHRWGPWYAQGHKMGKQQGQRLQVQGRWVEIPEFPWIPHSFPSTRLILKNSLI